MKKMRHLNLFSVIGLVFITVVTLLGFYWLLIDPDVITVENVGAFPVNKTEYSPGDHVTYTFSYCKKRKTVAVVYRALVDTYRITYATIESDLPVGCHTIQVNDLVIPDFIEGQGHTYHIEGTSKHWVNPLRSQYVYFRTENFKVK